MNPLTVMEEPPIRARIPADLDTPDRLVAGLTARQVGVLAAVAVPGYGLGMSLSGRVSLVVLTVAGAVLAALALVVALGRRDGLSLDRWLIAALQHARRPHRLIPTRRGPVPSWAPPAPGPGPRLGVLRLPAEAISADGVVTTGPGTATVLVAAATVTSGLHTPTEQAVLLGGYARWLNALSGPVQVLVSGRRVDLGPQALHLAENAHLLPHPALARAAIEHAEHLLDLSEDNEFLTRTVTIACTASAPPARREPRDASSPAVARSGARSGAGAEALRRAERTAAALSLISPRCRVLEGGEVTALLVAATDPYGPSDASWARTAPTATITAPGPQDAVDRSSSQSPWATAQSTGWEQDGVGARGEQGEGGWCP